MTSFRAAAGSGEDWPSACDHCLKGLDPLPPGSNLGIVYVGGALAHALDLIAARLQQATGIDAWVGTGGVGVCAGGPIAEPAGSPGADPSTIRLATSDDEALAGITMSVLTAALPEGAFRLFDGVLEQSGELGIFDAPFAHDVQKNGVAIVHGDPRQARCTSMVERLGLATGAFLVGGLTSAIASGGMQIAGRPTEGGLSGVVMSPDIPVISGLTQGCTPIGPERIITGIDGPWITTLDDRPALEGLREDVGPLLARNWERMTGFVLAARPNSGSARNDFLVRDLGGVDPFRGFVMVGDDFSRGDRLCFVKRDPEAARADLLRLTDDLRSRAGARPILGALYHSSSGRGRHLFGADDAERIIIQEALGAMPLAGFRSNGEIFRDRLYGYSAVLTLFLGDEPA